MAGKSGISILKAATVTGWHRKGLGLLWSWKIRHGKAGRPGVPKAVRQLIRTLRRENPLWGAPHIHGELLKLGINIGETRVSTDMGIKQVLSAPRSPWQRAYVERMIGSIRRECLDHLIVFNERSLSRHLELFVECYHRDRVHMALQKDTGAPTDSAAGVWPNRLNTGAGRAASPIRAARIFSRWTV